MARYVKPCSALGALLCCTALAACGGSAGSGAQAHPRAVNEVLASRAARPPAGPSARAARAPWRPFAAGSIWNAALSEDAPLEPNSAEMVAALDQQVAREQAARSGPWINTSSYGVPIVRVGAGQPTVSVALDHAPDAALSEAWSAVPLPASAQPSSDSDGYMVVWQPSTRRMWEFWQLKRKEDGWHASWGGAIQHVPRNPGVYGPEAWPGAKPWWGATASSLALAAGVMTIEQLHAGVINHALAIALPQVRAGVFASPARRTDGNTNDPLALPEGAHLRLDPHLNLASLSMPPLVREMALAAQRYGIVVRDVSGNVAFIAQDPKGTGSDPYTNGFYEGKYPSQLLASFPWSHLQVLKMELHSNP